MPTLILTVLFAGLFGYFATQNTMSVPIHITSFTYPTVPLYIVMLGSLLVGLLVAGLISFVNGIGTFFSLHGKDSRVNQLEKQIVTLEKENTSLREEHSVLKEKNRVVKDEVLAEKHPLLHDVKHTLS